MTIPYFSAKVFCYLQTNLAKNTTIFTSQFSKQFSANPFLSQSTRTFSTDKAKKPSKMSQKIQFYTWTTPNGQKLGVALEEMGLEYDLHLTNISKGEQFTEDFKKVNPNSKIPAITDPNGPGGKSINLFESGAILVYLAEKTGKFLPTDPIQRYQTLQWLFFQMAGIGPMFGQFGHFNRAAPEKIPYAIERYSKEARRLYEVLDKQLEGKNFIVGDEYTIADMATLPWIKSLHKFAAEVLQLDQFKNVDAWMTRCSARPATEKGLKVGFSD